METYEYTFNNQKFVFDHELNDDEMRMLLDMTANCESPNLLVPQWVIDAKPKDEIPPLPPDIVRECIFHAGDDAPKWLYECNLLATAKFGVDLQFVEYSNGNRELRPLASMPVGQSAISITPLIDTENIKCVFRFPQPTHFDPEPMGAGPVQVEQIAIYDRALTEKERNSVFVEVAPDQIPGCTHWKSEYFTLDLSKLEGKEVAPGVYQYDVPEEAMRAPSIDTNNEELTLEPRKAMLEPADSAIRIPDKALAEGAVWDSFNTYSVLSNGDVYINGELDEKATEERRKAMGK